MTVFNSQPYYDDFDESKGFQQILFKPGYAVQARELTQLQTILKDQIAKFGKHIFKQGSVVIPGNAAADTNVPFIKIASTYSGNAININNFIGATLVGPSHGGQTVKAVVKHIEPATATDPHTLYLVYTQGAGASGINTFQDSETVTVYVNGVATSIAATLLPSGSIGSGSLVHVNKGVFFVNGNFVYCGDQTITISKYTTTPSCHVMLKIVESIIDSDIDESLLDPANGTNNYAAPGADRYKVDLQLTTLGLDATITDDYVELMRFNNGVMEENNRYAQYSELEKTLARRTYDESGDYRVNGFDINIRDHLKTLFNDGVSETGNAAKFVVDVTSGKAYINGYEIERLSNARLVLDKGRTSDHVKVARASINNDYGRYIYVSDVVNLPDFGTHEIINLFNYAGGTQVGTAYAYALDYFDGTPTAPGAVYKLFVHDLVLTGAYTLADIGYYSGSSTTSATGKVLQRLSVPNATKDFTVGEIVNTAGSVRTATVKYYTRSTGDLYVYKYNATATPQMSEIITGATSTAVATISGLEQTAAVGLLPLFRVPSDAIRAMKTATNTYDTQYTVVKRFTVTVAAGTGSATIAGGYFLPPEAGVTTITGSAGVVNVSYASLSSSTTFTLSGGIANGTYYVTTQYVKTAGQPKSKSKATYNMTGVTPAWTISLGKCDIFKINSIIDNTGTDWTSLFILDNGQTDFYYGVGSVLFNGTTLPTGVTLTINFDYFTHGAGDYFNVDSYASLETVAGSYDYLPLIPKYKSKTTNVEYYLRNFMDFRPRIGESNSNIEIVVPGTITSSSFQYYVPRVDSIYFGTDKVIDAVRGIPNDSPSAPAVPANTLKLASLYIPAYTNSVDDIIITLEKNQRYTMRDISKLEDRIANVEYFSTLNSVEQSLLTFEVPDAATGLNRFKTGYLVDNFSNPFTICDYYNPLSGVQFRSLELSPSVETHDSALIVDESTSSNYQITGNQVTMPYTEVAFINQDKSTRVTNVNHFLLINWEGHMTIVPPIDNWIDTEYLPTIYNTVNNTVTVTREEHVTVWDPAPAEPAQRPLPAPTVNIALPNSLAWAGATGQTVFSVPANAVTMSSPGIYELVPSITEQQARDWVTNQYNSGLTHPRAAGETSGHLLLDN